MLITLLPPVVGGGGGTALKFNGSQYIQIASLPDNITFGYDDFTISIHLKNIQYWGDGYHRNPILTDAHPTGAVPRITFLVNVTDSKGMVFSSVIVDKNSNTTGFDSKPQLPSQLSSFHFAVVQHNKIIRYYVNGTEIGTPVDTSTIKGIGHYKSNPLNVGYLPWSANNYKHLFATIDDFCIIKGKAVWTSNFTPPTSYLPDYEYL